MGRHKSALSNLHKCIWSSPQPPMEARWNRCSHVPPTAVEHVTHPGEPITLRRRACTVMLDWSATLALLYVHVSLSLCVCVTHGQRVVERITVSAKMINAGNTC